MAGRAASWQSAPCLTRTAKIEFRFHQMKTTAGRALSISAFIPRPTRVS